LAEQRTLFTKVVAAVADLIAVLIALAIRVGIVGISTLVHAALLLLEVLLAGTAKAVRTVGARPTGAAASISTTDLVHTRGEAGGVVDQAVAVVVDPVARDLGGGRVHVLVRVVAIRAISAGRRENEITISVGVGAGAFLVDQVVAIVVDPVATDLRSVHEDDLVPIATIGAAGAVDRDSRMPISV
jgi:hypothetical protein